MSARASSVLASPEFDADAAPVETLSLRGFGGRLPLLLGTIAAASVLMATADAAIPPALRVAIAVANVLLLPGFAIVCAFFPTLRLTVAELLLASAGMSMAVATGIAMVLGATTVGLSRESFALAIGGSTVALCLIAVVRSLIRTHSKSRHLRRPIRKSASKEV